MFMAIVFFLSILYPNPGSIKIKSNVTYTRELRGEITWPTLDSSVMAQKIIT